MNITILYYFIGLQELFKTVLDDSDYQEREEKLAPHAMVYNQVLISAQFYSIKSDIDMKDETIVRQA